MKQKRSAETRHRVPIFYQSDLPSAASHCDQEQCGFSLYRGVLVQWDEDQDERIFIFIDSMPAELRKALIFVQEHEAGLSLTWNDRIPDGYHNGAQFEIRSRDCGHMEYDYWNVWESRTLARIPLPENP